MDHIGQRVVLRFLFLKRLRYKTAHKELASLLGEQVCLLLRAKRWIHRFKEGDLSREDDGYIFHWNQTFGP
jgi:hypothetical protein